MQTGRVVFNQQNRLCEYNILSLKAKRMKLTNEEHQTLKRLQKGIQGEEMALEFIQKYGHPNWQIFRNVRFDKNSPYEVDILVVGKMGWIGFEVKNYEGNFTYENGSCYYEKNQMTRDIVAQTKRIHLKNSHLAQVLDAAISVKTALVFINQHNSIYIRDYPSEIDIVLRNELKKYIQKAAEIESRSYNNISIEEQVEKILEVQIGTYQHLPIISEATYSKMKKGIYCPLCSNFYVRRNKKVFKCDCGNREFVNQALKRTLEDYAILFHQKHLTLGEILDFIGNDVSKSTLYRVLKENYPFVGNTKARAYKNPVVEKIDSKLNLLEI